MHNNYWGAIKKYTTSTQLRKLIFSTYNLILTQLDEIWKNNTNLGAIELIFLNGVPLKKMKMKI
jgi:hypothetical protein